jgi:hypothetical protein
MAGDAVIAPTLNTECQAAVARYRTELISDDPAETRFQAISLDPVTAGWATPVPVPVPT